MKSLKKAVYPGTFDPFTNGHKHILDKALKIFDEVTILVAVSPTKAPLFPSGQRATMIRELFAGNKNIIVDSWDGLVVEYARKKKIQTIIRGLRPNGDFDIEFQMASMNSHLNPDIETVFFTTGSDNYFVSSSLVREVFKHGGDVSPYVPKEIFKHLKKI